MSEYSPLPWWKEVDPKGRLFGDSSPLHLVKCSRGVVAEIVGNEEADLIINAANSHESLLSAARTALVRMEHDKELAHDAQGEIQILRKAITEAGRSEV